MPAFADNTMFMAIAMKQLLIILFIILSNTVSGQGSGDTCITKTQFNEFKKKLYQLNDENRILSLRILLLTQLKLIDTLLQTKDSIVLSYVSKTNTILKKEKQTFSRGCMTDSVVTHFNVKGQTVYSEWWTVTCDIPDTIDNELVIYKYRSSYYRFEYDEESRMKKYVIHLSTPYTRRILCNYDSQGNKIQTVASINEYDSWD